MSQNQPSAPVWDLRSNIMPSFGARLMQEGCRLYFLADRASLCDNFTSEQLQTLEAIFPQFVKQIEAALSTGELNPHQAWRFTSSLNGMTLEANTNGISGHVYITVYPVTQSQGERQ